MREKVTTLLELLGAGCVTVGVMLVSVAAGLVVLGSFLVAVGWLEGQK